MKVEIIPATLRDLTYLAGNMRAEDWREISCQWPAGTKRTDIAAAAMQGREAWVATWKGQPVGAFGAAHLAASVLQAWAFGTRSMWRAAPVLSGWIMAEVVPRWLGEGITRVEARSIADHHAAHRWMQSMDAEVFPCRGQGRGGEDFLLFVWTASGSG